MRRGNPHSARSLSFYPYCHPPHLRNVALHHSGLPSPHRGMTTVPPPRLSADTAPKRRSSPDKLPHCLMQTVIARHVKFIRKLRLYIRNLRIYIRSFRIYIRNLRFYFMHRPGEVYPPGSAGLCTGQRPLPPESGACGCGIAAPAMHGCGRGVCERCVIVPPHQTLLLVVAVAVLWMIVAMTGRAAAV